MHACLQLCLLVDTPSSYIVTKVKNPSIHNHPTETIPVVSYPNKDERNNLSIHNLVIDSYEIMTSYLEIISNASTSPMW